MVLYLQWCRDSEHALLQCGYDRRALAGARNKFTSGVVNKLVALLMKNSWKAVDEVLTPVKRASLEALVTVTSKQKNTDTILFNQFFSLF